ncbi:MAG: hypothetical protein MJZ60_09410 [Bacteroidaceae bacterium]|nr:hypothetical protein [Bacteroidaceae bacterium]
MKKLLLLFVAAIATLSVNAKVVKVNMDNVKDKWVKTENGFTLSYEGLNFTFDKAESSSDLVDPTDLIKIYVGSVLTIENTEEENITTASFACYSDKYCVDGTWSAGKATIEGTNLKWEGSTTKLSFTAVKQIRVSEIIITTGDSKYEEKDITNTVETAYTITEAVQLIQAGEGLSQTVFVKGIISKIDNFNEKYGSLTYWLSEDGSTSAQQFQCYSGLNVNGEKFTSEEDLQVGAEVIVKGVMKKYKPQEGAEIYEFDMNNEIVSLATSIEEVEEVAAQPKSMKVMQNGRLVIINNGKKYNAAGMMMK